MTLLSYILLLLIVFFDFSINCSAIGPIGKFLWQQRLHRDRVLHDYLALRCSASRRLKFNKPMVWYYTGHLRNPLTGNEIAGVEGVEIVKLLPGSYNSTSDKYWDSYSYMVKKIFVYTPLWNHSNVLTSYRVNPMSPRRRITNPSKEYYEIIHIKPFPPLMNGLRRLTDFNNQNSNYYTGYYNNNYFNQTEYEEDYYNRRFNDRWSFRRSRRRIKRSTDYKNTYSVQVEWPGGRTVSTNKFKIHVDNSVPSVRRFDVTNFVSGNPRRLRFRNGRYRDWRTRWPWRISRWISFAGSNDLHGKSQEYYSYNQIPFHQLDHFKRILASLIPGHNFDPFIHAKAEMVYRRYGESPSWYSLGHSSTMELNGYAFSSPKFLPKYTRNLIDDVAPHFLSDTPTVEAFEYEDDLYRKYRPWYSYLLPPRGIQKSKMYDESTLSG